VARDRARDGAFEPLSIDDNVCHADDLSRSFEGVVIQVLPLDYRVEWPKDGIQTHLRGELIGHDDNDADG